MRDPGDVLQAAFDSLVAKLSANLTCELPRRRYIAVDQEPYDCAQFVVHGGAVYQGTPGQPLGGYQVGTGGIALHSFDVAATIVRPYPVADGTGRPPPTDQLTQASLRAASDSKSLTDAFYAAMEDNSIAGPCDFVYFGGVSWVGPSGGLLGTMLSMAIQL